MIYFGLSYNCRNVLFSSLCNEELLHSLIIFIVFIIEFVPFDH
jgi:hypothetical protein